MRPCTPSKVLAAGKADRFFVSARNCKTNFMLKNYSSVAANVMKSGQSPAGEQHALSGAKVREQSDFITMSDRIRSQRVRESLDMQRGAVLDRIIEYFSHINGTPDVPAAVRQTVCSLSDRRNGAAARWQSRRARLCAVRDRLMKRRATETDPTRLVRIERTITAVDRDIIRADRELLAIDREYIRGLEVLAGKTGETHNPPRNLLT